jgi:LysR family transcriptional regulator, transcriptional activator for aaeXAB operon
VEHVDAFAIFAKVGELGSISGAARALGLPKANVSRAVTRLEATYKVALVDRTTRRILLTEVGRTFHSRCLRVLEELDEAGAEMAAHRGHPAGTLRVGCPGDVGRDLLGPHLHEFLERYPEIDMRLRIGERLLPQPGGFDVVLHAGWLSDSRLVGRKIAEIPTLLVASTGYCEEYGVPNSITDLANHAVIGNFYLDRATIEPDRLPAHVPILELSRDAERYPVPIWQRFTTTDHTIMLEMVKRGVAIAPIALVRAIEGLRSGELVRILPDYTLHDPPTLSALYTDRNALAPKIKVFIEFVVELVHRQRDALRDSGLSAEIGKPFGNHAVSKSEQHGAD